MIFHLSLDRIATPWPIPSAWWLLQLTLKIFNIVLDCYPFQNSHEGTLVTIIEQKERHMLWGLKGKAKDWMASPSDLMKLQKMKIAQPNKSLMTVALELLVMMVIIEMILVVVPPHLPHKEEVMSDLSLPSRLTSSHTALRIQTTVPRYRQEFR
jgi:hypothetical protein